MDNLHNPHLGNPLPEDNSNTPPAPVLGITSDGAEYLLKLREQLVYSAAYTQYQWEAPNLAVVSAAQGFMRGQLALLDDLLAAAKIII